MAKCRECAERVVLLLATAGDCDIVIVVLFVESAVKQVLQSSAPCHDETPKEPRQRDQKLRRADQTKTKSFQLNEDLNLKKSS